MGEPAQKRDEDAERIDRLIAAQEAQTNELRRLVQLLERREQKRPAKVARARRAPTRKVVVSDRAEALAKAALARHRDQG
jgi:hypothetical protein